MNDVLAAFLAVFFSILPAWLVVASAGRGSDEPHTPTLTLLPQTSFGGTDEP